MDFQNKLPHKVALRNLQSADWHWSYLQNQIISKSLKRKVFDADRSSKVNLVAIPFEFCFGKSKDRRYVTFVCRE